MLLEIARKGDVFIKQDLVKNKNLSNYILHELEKTEINEYIGRKIKSHPNYIKNSKTLEEQMTDAKGRASALSENRILKEQERE